MKKTFIAISALVLLLTGCSSGNSAITGVNANEFVQKIGDQSIQVIDVRTAGEYAEGHLTNSLNIDAEGYTFDSDIAKLDKSKTYALYCHSGRRSAIAANAMAKAGFTSIINLQGGGFAELVSAGATTA